MCEEPGVKGKGGGRVNCDAIRRRRPSKRNQIAGFRLLGVGEKARHLDGDKERGRSSNADSLDSVGDGTIRREAFWAGVNDLNDSFEGSKGFNLRCQLMRVFLEGFGAILAGQCSQ